MPEIWKVNNRSGPTERSEDVASRSRGRTAPAVMARGLIARLAVWCFRHRWWVVACWAVIAAVGAVCSAGVLDRVETTGLVSRNAESSVADRVLTAAGVSQDDVLVLIDGVDVKAAATREAVSGAAQRIAAMPEVAKVTDWYEAGMPQLQSRDGRATVISVRLKEADSRVTDGSLKAFNDAVNPLRSTLSGASVALGGESILWKQLADQSAADLQRGERISLPVTFIALIIIFGG
jgi:RND superfamily putative drug exporter